MKTSLLALLASCVAGCYGAHRDSANNLPDAGGTADGGPQCGDVTCDETPAPTCADATTLRTYEAACSDGACSYPSTDVACGAYGCCEDHCCEVEPSNADVFGGLEPNGLVVAPPNGTFDTSAGCVASTALGACTVASRGPDLGEACVCRADEITIGTLRVTGARALVLLAAKRIEVTTLLDVSGDPGVDGPGASRRYPAPAHGYDGGVGGSYATKGAGSAGKTAAATYGTAALVPLLGGMTGEAGGAGGGGGGGAVQLTAGERIVIAGAINAGGGGGRAGIDVRSAAGAGGGGSGGAVLLEAPTVVVSGVVVANGGGGGGGGGSDEGSGSDGWGGGEVSTGTATPNRLAPAYGGFGDDGDGCPLYGYVSGGDGGAGAVGTTAPGYGEAGDTDSRCFGSTSYVASGGGGGGVGRIRINTAGGCQCGGDVSPAASFGTLAKR